MHRPPARYWLVVTGALLFEALYLLPGSPGAGYDWWFPIIWLAVVVGTGLGWAIARWLLVAYLVVNVLLVLSLRPLFEAKHVILVGLGVAIITVLCSSLMRRNRRGTPTRSLNSPPTPPRPT